MARRRKDRAKSTTSMRGFDIIGRNEREVVQTGRAIAASSAGVGAVRVENGKVIQEPAPSNLLPGQRPTGQGNGNLPIKVGSWNVAQQPIVRNPLPGATSGSGQVVAGSTIDPNMAPTDVIGLSPWEKSTLEGAAKNPADFLMKQQEQLGWFEQQAAQRAPDNFALKSISNWADKGVHWATRVFDSSDTFANDSSLEFSEEGPDTPVEAVFDGFMQVANWGMDTLGWGAAGAMLAANPNYWAYRDSNGRTGNLWQDATNVASGEALQALASPVQDILGQVVTGEKQGVYSYRPGFNIADPAQRDEQYRNNEATTRIDDPLGMMLTLGGPLTAPAKAIREASRAVGGPTGDLGAIDVSPAMLGSGLGGAVVGLGTEELLTLGAGKFLKWGRVRYVDGLIDSPETAARVIQTVNDDKRILQNNLTIDTQDGVTINRAIEDLSVDEVNNLSVSPITRFLHEVSRGTIDEATGLRVKDVKYRDIYNHRAIRWSGNRGALARAFENANSFDEAELIWRHAIGDESAQAALAQMRPDLLRGVLNGERALIQQMLSSNPTMVAKEADKWWKRHDILLKKMEDMKDAGVDEARIAEVRAQADEVAEIWKDAANATVREVGDGPLVPDAEISLLRDAIDFELQRNDLFINSLERANGQASALYGTMRESVAGLGGVGGKSIFGDTAIGRHMDMLDARDVNNIGRIVHQSRMKRAAAKTATQGGKIREGWKWDEFTSLYGNPIARVIYWSGNERPSGVMRTAGISAQESEREVMALLDSIDLYNGEGRYIVRETKRKVKDENGKIVRDEAGKPVWEATTVERLVGGTARKDELIRQYTNSLLKGGEAGEVDMKKFLDDLEEEMVKDIADYHGISRQALDEVHYRQNRRLEKIATQVKSEGFWFEDGVKHHAPFLESQIENSRFMKNWRRIDQIAEHMARQDKGGLLGRADSVGEGLGQAIDMLNEGFQSFWRPAVLLRPGYTVRNVTEGTIRAMAFQYSLMPAFYAVQQLAISMSVNRGGRLFGRTRRAYEVVEQAKKTGFDNMPKRFTDWHDAQRVATANELHATGRAIDFQVETLATVSSVYRAQRIEQQTQKAFALIDQRDALRAAGDADEGTLAAINARIADIEDEVNRLKAIQGGDDTIDDIDQRVIDNIDYFEQVHLPFIEGVRASLDDPIAAAQMYRKQAIAKRRVFAQHKEVADYESMASIMRGKALEDPFSTADPFSSIALSNLSADGTQRMAAGLRQQAFSDAMKVIETRYYVPVRRGEPTYYDAIATVLNQYQNSDYGRIIIAGRAQGLPDEEIVKQASRWMIEQKGTPEWERSWFGDWVNQSMRQMGKGDFEGVADRTARGVKAAEKAVEPLDVAIKASKADRTALRRSIRAAEKDFEARQAASSRELKTYVVDGKRKTRAQMDKMLEDADRRLFEAQEARQTTWDNAVIVARKDANRYGADTLEDATEFSAEVLRRYDEVTGGAGDLHRYLYADEQLPMGKAKGETEAGQIIKSFLDKRDDGGLPMYELPREVIGTMSVKAATKTPSEWMHDASQWGFDKFGTIPEDMFVRAPFYGKRFNQTANTMYRQIVSQVGEDGVTMRHVNMIREAAHRRALKDTKDWLYTIDRRTNLGDTLENIIPFVSATQNSVTVMGRLLWKDPSLVAWVKMAWQAPDYILQDEDGNPDSIAIPLTLIRDLPGLKQFMDWGGMDDKIHVNKNGIDLFTQGIFDPQAQGLIKIPVSEVYKKGWLQAENPLKAAGVVDDNALLDTLWDEMRKFTLGTDDATGEPRGPSERFLSLDYALAPWQQSITDAFWNNGGTIGSYAKNFSRIEMQAQAEYMAGLRDEPTFDEIAGKATAMTAARAGIYLLPFLTTPKQVSKYEPLLGAIKAMDSAYREDQERLDAIDAERAAAGQPPMTMEERNDLAQVMPPDQVFGETVTWAFGQGSSRKYTAGLPVIPEAQDFAIGTESYIREVAPRLEKNGRLNLLGMFVQNPDDVYDNTTAAWMMANRIPGTTENYAETLDPAGARAEQRRSAGWTKYMQGADTITALMHESGFTNRKQAGAETFDQAYTKLVDDIANDPRYGMDWYADFDDPNGEKQQEALRVMAGAFTDPDFNEFFKDDPVWGQGGAAHSYLTARQSVVDGLQYLEDVRDSQGIRSWQDADAQDLSMARDQLLAQWGEIKKTFDMSSPDWVTIRLRYIGDDDDPKDIGMRFGG